MAFDQPFVWQDQMTEVTRQDTIADGTAEKEITFVPVFRADQAGGGIECPRSPQLSHTDMRQTWPRRRKP